MEIRELLDEVLLSMDGVTLSVGHLLQVVIVIAGLLLVSLLLHRQWLPKYFSAHEINESEQKRLRRRVILCLSLLGILFVMWRLGLEYPLFQVPFGEGTVVSVRTIVSILWVLVLTLLADWFAHRLLINRYQKQRTTANSTIIYNYRYLSQSSGASRVISPFIYVLAAIFVMQSLHLDEFRLFTIPQGNEDVGIYLTTVFNVLLILAFVRLIIWVFSNIILYQYYSRQQVDIGSQYAINRLISYFLYVIGFLFALSSIGLNLQLIWGGAAALLVGIGLGLQQTFNDLVCGIILLFERTVEVNDVVEIDDVVGSVRKIGTRTSLVETRDNITVIVPNSKLVGENVINWSHFERKARFQVSVGVAYGSDTELVRSILQEVAKNHKKVLAQPEPFVRFVDFGNSSLNFTLHFFSREFIRIEDVKSDLRFAIDQRFRESGVTIPFPQRDLWVRNPEQLRASPNGQHQAQPSSSPPEAEADPTASA